MSNSPIRLSEEYNLELQYRKPFLDVWKEEKDDPELGPLSERMGVRARGGGPLLVTEEELEAASKFLPFFCVRKKNSSLAFRLHFLLSHRLLSRLLFLQGVRNRWLLRMHAF